MSHEKDQWRHRSLLFDILSAAGRDGPCYVKYDDAADAKEVHGRGVPPFCLHSYFFWVTGRSAPGSVAVLDPTTRQYTLYSDRDITGMDDALEQHLPLSALPPGLLEGGTDLTSVEEMAIPYYVSLCDVPCDLTCGDRVSSHRCDCGYYPCQCAEPLCPTCARVWLRAKAYALNHYNWAWERKRRESVELSRLGQSDPDALSSLLDWIEDYDDYYGDVEGLREFYLSRKAKADIPRLKAEMALADRAYTKMKEEQEEKRWRLKAEDEERRVLDEYERGSNPGVKLWCETYEECCGRRRQEARWAREERQMKERRMMNPRLQAMLVGLGRSKEW
ncbi:hypothetical protein KIPB_008900 [Kipferlia bialata]|uniref:Uncharacterized protein n=1 Tax=Kipferlia bialata TaxID=797122 RepID=A0A9K3GK74_9EUKA|nr:hypothetical protein KIPB_008900 [Kipferlia bialata]|eukprot:g8900.t1